MKEAEFLHWRSENAAGWIEIDRFEKANAYTKAMLDELEKALAELVETPSVRVVVIRSAVPGRFCAGADRDEIAGRTAIDGLNLTSTKIFDRLAGCPKPTLAAIDGPAFGGGLELALACDLRLATSRARFALPETSLGLLPAAGAIWRLPQLVGLGLAREMILMGKELDASRALQAGLVNHLVEPEQLESTIDSWIETLAKRDSLALQLAKEALARSVNENEARAYALTAQALLYQMAHERTRKE